MPCRASDSDAGGRSVGGPEKPPPGRVRGPTLAGSARPQRLLTPVVLLQARETVGVVRPRVGIAGQPVGAGAVEGPCEKGGGRVHRGISGDAGRVARTLPV